MIKRHLEKVLKFSVCSLHFSDISTHFIFYCRCFVQSFSTGKLSTTLNMQILHMYLLHQKESITAEDSNITAREKAKRTRNPRTTGIREQHTTNMITPLMMTLYPHPHHHTLTTAPVLPTLQRTNIGTNNNTHILTGGKSNNWSP